MLQAYLPILIFIGVALIMGSVIVLAGRLLGPHTRLLLVYADLHREDVERLQRRQFAVGGHAGQLLRVHLPDGAAGQRPLPDGLGRARG